VASDGGGSRGGGLWRTNDSGNTFKALAPPEASITALAVSNDEAPTLYVASFRPTDHQASLWVYHDTGGTPQGPATTPTPVVSGTRIVHQGKSNQLLDFLAQPEAPYIALGVVAVLLLITAGISQLRARHR